MSCFPKSSSSPPPQPPTTQQVEEKQQTGEHSHHHHQRQQRYDDQVAIFLESALTSWTDLEFPVFGIFIYELPFMTMSVNDLVGFTKNADSSVKDYF